MLRALIRIEGGALAVIVALGAATVLGSCAEDDPASQSGITCSEFCERHIDCDSDPDGRCPLACSILRERCHDLARDLAECLMSRPDSDFECNEDEVTRPKAGVCQEQQDAISDCAEGLLTE